MVNNLFNSEHHFRLLFGILIIIYASINTTWLILPVGILLVFTGNIKFCPIYYLLGINNDVIRSNKILAHLPKNNPEPVFIFDQKGDLIFRNDSAKNILPSLKSLTDLEGASENTELLASGRRKVKGFHENNKSYMLHYKPIESINGVVAYGFNVTDLVEVNEEIINTQKELLYHMGEIGETRSKETGNHVKRVAEYSYLLASLLKLDTEQCHLLKMASPMHDIGKVAIPDSILLKPGKLNNDEWTVMKTHAAIGHDLLKNSERPILKAAAIVAGEHHEKWDGSGYPIGTSKNDIHIFGRITALADVYDALASDRVYKKAWPIEDVIKLIKSESEKHFDPTLVSLFLKNQDKFDAIRQAYTD